ncbi:MAG: hypothetical protein R3322_00280 [Kiloniellales bacterium]|nr:hypothetical protein [Kiloniellales bacterium]
MSYIPMGFTPAQEDALLAFSPDELNKLDLMERVELAMRHREIRAEERATFWQAVQAFAVAVVPMAAGLGLARLFEAKR